jgi:hypothetical protein
VYADAILDKLDPARTLFKEQIYRSHGTQTTCGNWDLNLKDLRYIDGDIDFS